MDCTPPSTLAPATIRLAWALRASLGEGPVWLDDERALWFVDIEGRWLHRYDPRDGRRLSYAAPGRPSFVVPAGDGSLLVGIERQLWKFREGAFVAPVAEVPAPPGTRTNDGVVDARGRLWFGTMDDAKSAPIGQVHRFEAGVVHAAGGHARITNGPATSPDGRVLYHVDTRGGRVWAFDIATRDSLVDGEVFATIDPADGTPDGVTVDAEGGVWVAIWGGWCVRRYSAGGSLLATVPVPASQVTKIAFGGDDLRTAFVTTARETLDEVQLREEPEAGGLFAFEAPVAGLPTARVAWP